MLAWCYEQERGELLSAQRSHVLVVAELVTAVLDPLALIT